MLFEGQGYKVEVINLWLLFKVKHIYYVYTDTFGITISNNILLTNISMAKRKKVVSPFSLFFFVDILISPKKKKKRDFKLSSDTRNILLTSSSKNKIQKYIIIVYRYCQLSFCSRDEKLNKMGIRHFCTVPSII